MPQLTSTLMVGQIDITYGLHGFKHLIESPNPSCAKPGVSQHQTMNLKHSLKGRGSAILDQSSQRTQHLAHELVSLRFLRRQLTLLIPLIWCSYWSYSTNLVKSFQVDRIRLIRTSIYHDFYNRTIKSNQNLPHQTPKEVFNEYPCTILLIVHVTYFSARVFSVPLKESCRNASQNTLIHGCSHVLPSVVFRTIEQIYTTGQ